MLARADVNSCQPEHRVMLQRSGDDGATWEENWMPVSDQNGEIYGYPSRPKFHFNNFSIFSYADIDATYIRSALATISSGASFTDTTLDIAPKLNVPQGDSYFTVSKDHLAGNFEIGPITSMAVNQAKGWLYVVYQDLHEPVLEGEDGDFDVYLRRGEIDGTTINWEANPRRVNDDPIGGNVKADQFMPVIVYDGGVRIYVAWYDTRHDLKSPGEDVKISLYLRRASDIAGNFVWEDEIMLKGEAIDTSYLTNDKFIGDYIDVTADYEFGVFSEAVVVYMGTTHPIYIPGFGFRSNGIGGIEPSQSNEAILSQRIIFDPFL